MESLPQIATALQHDLTTVAESAAAEVGFVRRRRMLSGASFVQALVLGWLACPEATLHQLTQGLAVRGTPPARTAWRSASRPPRPLSWSGCWPPPWRPSSRGPVRRSPC